MYELKVIDDFSSAHRLRGYKGKCEELHGHNWKIELFLQAEELNSIGLAIDFHDVKRELKEVLKKLDHKLINDIEYFQQVNPSSENLAKYLYDKMSKKLNDDNVKVSKLTVWESDTACASFYR